MLYAKVTPLRNLPSWMPKTTLKWRKTLPNQVWNTPSAFRTRHADGKVCCITGVFLAWHREFFPALCETDWISFHIVRKQQQLRSAFFFFFFFFFAMSVSGTLNRNWIDRTAHKVGDYEREPGWVSTSTNLLWDNTHLASTDFVMAFSESLGDRADVVRDLVMSGCGC